MKPKTRLEWFLAKIAGDSDATGSLTPRTRKEYFLNEIADSAGGSDPYAGYDVVIRLAVSENLQDLTDEQVTLVRGSYQSCMSKIESGGVLNIMVYHSDFEDDSIYYHQIPVITVYADSGYHDAVEILVTGYPHTASISNTLICGAVQASATKLLFLTESGVSVTEPWA